MFSYSVKLICGIQSERAEGQHCTPVRPAAYATEINIHNYNRENEATIEKRALLLIHNDSPVGREPRFAKAQRFDKIVLPPDAATMDDCCNFSEKLKADPGHLTIGFLELVSSVELNVVSLYTATDLRSNVVSIDFETVRERLV
jgi:hypothetical protein